MSTEMAVFFTLTLSVALMVMNVDAYAVFGSRRFVRPVRSSWRSAPAVPRYPDPSYYYPSLDYEEEVPDDGALYSDTVNYYPPPRYYYGRADPVDDLQMEMRNEERGADLPIGQETWFERQTAAQAAAQERAAANDAFMQNLIIAELYRDQPQAGGSYYGYNAGGDQEERDLRSLSQVKRSENIAESSVTAKPEVPVKVTSKVAPVKAQAGQKEVAMLRPPSPARSGPQPLSSGHAPSVYDTIKQLLSMEAKEGGKDQAVRAPPQKRFVSSEEALVKQLSSLKKVAA